MTFAHETTVKAVRKAGRCDGCGQMVDVGQPAIRWAGMTDGEFGHALYHVECRAAEITLNRLHDLNWDEWISLRNDRDSEDDPWLLAEHPVVAARLGIAAPTHPINDIVERDSEVR